jgi:hypothetical protein
MKHKFNGAKLAKDILAKRNKENLSFRGIEKTTKGKLTISTLQRLEDNTQEPKASTLGDVCNWLGKDISIYYA